jgi:hypothetical protein
MLIFHEVARISLEELLEHQIFNIRASRILNLKLDGSGKNPLSRSIERHLTNLSSGNFRLVSEQTYAQLSQLSQQPFSVQVSAAAGSGGAPDCESNQIESEDS